MDARRKALAMKAEILMTARNPRIEARLSQNYALHLLSDYSHRTECLAAVGQQVSGIFHANAGGVNAVDVTEFAIAMLIGAGRNINGGIYHARSGQRQERRIGLTRRVSGRPLGIPGLGNIGQPIARCAETFDMPVFYHSRHERLDQPYSCVETVLDLAKQVDFW